MKNERVEEVDYRGCRDECKSLINGEVQQRKETYFSKLKTLIKNRVPYSVRESQLKQCVAPFLISIA